MGNIHSAVIFMLTLTGLGGYVGQEHSVYWHWELLKRRDTVYEGGVLLVLVLCIKGEPSQINATLFVYCLAWHSQFPSGCLFLSFFFLCVCGLIVLRGGSRVSNFCCFWWNCKLCNIFNISHTCWQCIGSRELGAGLDLEWLITDTLSKLCMWNWKEWDVNCYTSSTDH